MKLSRRDLLKLGAGAAAICATRIDLLHAEPESPGKKKIPIGLQLYSVRDACGKDFPGVLAALGKMGYQGVEFAGYYGRNAVQLRKMLDDNGLICCGTHTGLDTLMGNNFQRTVDFHKTLGNKYLIVPGMGGDRLGSPEAIKKTAALFTELAEKVKPLGMYVGYHAHGGDFRKFGGETVWEILYGNAGPDVIMQMDIGNCLGGGSDPYAILKKFPGRSLTIHLKEHGGKHGATIGQGTVKWDEVFQICETTGKTEWYVVEQESYTGSSLDSVKQCLENLKKMGK